MEVKQIFATRLKRLRVENDKTLSELANDLGITAQSLSLYERGERVPTIETLVKTAKHFNVSADYLVGLTNERDAANKDETTGEWIDTATTLTGLNDTVIMFFINCQLKKDWLPADILNEFFEHTDLAFEVIARLDLFIRFSYDCYDRKCAQFLSDSANATDSMRYHLHNILEKVLDLYDFRKNYSAIIAPYAEKSKREIDEMIKEDEREKDGEPNGKHNPPEE